MDFNTKIEYFNEDFKKLSLEEQETIGEVKGNAPVHFYEIALERGRASERDRIKDIPIVDYDVVSENINELEGIATILKNFSSNDNIEANADTFLFLYKAIERISDNLNGGICLIEDII